MIFQAPVTNKPMLPVPIDGNLPHIQIPLGDLGGLNPSVSACVDTGAGANVGYLPFFESLCALHPDIIDTFYCSKTGPYAPIKMSGIVSEDTEGVTSTDLPLAVRLKTPFTDRDGKKVMITVALGEAVAINFIISNSWLKRTGSRIDYGTGKLYVDFGEDTKGFHLRYGPPKRKSIDKESHKELGYYKRHIPNLLGMQSVLQAYNPESIWLAHVTTVIDHFSAQVSSKPVRPQAKPPFYRSSRTTLIAQPRHGLSTRFSFAARPAKSALSPGQYSQRASAVNKSGQDTDVTYYGPPQPGGDDTALGHVTGVGDLNPGPQSDSDNSLFPSSQDSSDEE